MHARSQSSHGEHKMKSDRSVVNGALLLGCWLAVSTSSVAAATLVARTLIA